MKKTMNFMLALLLFSLVSFAQNSLKKIGEDQNGQYKITDNLELVKSDWMKILKDQRNPAVLVNFEIKASVNNKTNEKFYMLLATSQDKSLKMAGTLILKNGVFSIDMANDDYKNGGIVVCEGCKEGCDPEKEGINWVCSNSCGPACSRSMTLSGQG